MYYITTISRWMGYEGAYSQKWTRIYAIYMGQFKMNGLQAYRKSTSDWSDTTAKHLTVDQKVPGLNPTCCFVGKVVKVYNFYLQ